MNRRQLGSRLLEVSITLDDNVAMDLEQLDVVSRCVGQTLTPQERSNLEIGLIKRRATESLLSIRFWGRISGEAQDYVVAVALLPGKEYPKKKFYFWYVLYMHAL